MKFVINVGVYKRSDKVGLVSIDYVIGFVVMLVIIGVFISFVVWISAPGGPFQVAIREIALRGAQEIEGKSSWILTRTPIVIESAGTNLPVEIEFAPPANVDPNSIVVTNARGDPILSEYDNSTNQVAWDAYLAPGRNIFYLVHTEGTRLRPLNWTTLSTEYVVSENVTGGFRLSKPRTNISFGPAGVYDLLVDDKRPLRVTGLPSIDLGPNAGLTAPSIRGKEARKVLSYANRITIKVFANDSKIWIQAPKTTPIPTLTLQLPTSMTRFYTSALGSEQTISGSTPGYLVQEQLNHILDVYDQTNDVGIAIIGNRRPANVSLYDNVVDYRAIIVHNASDFFILPHRGDFTAALAEAHLSSNPPNITIGVPTITQGISRQKFQLTGAQALIDYEAFKRAHALLGFDYNVTIEEVQR